MQARWDARIYAREDARQIEYQHIWQSPDKMQEYMSDSNNAREDVR